MPAVTLFEWDSCLGESTSLGVRNFTVYDNGVVTEKDYSWFEFGYPGEDANSFSVPYNGKIDFYDNSDYKGTI